MPEQRPALAARQRSIRLARGGAGPFEVAHDHGIDPQIERFDPADGVLEQFDRGNLARVEQRPQLAHAAVIQALSQTGRARLLGGSRVG